MFPVHCRFCHNEVGRLGANAVVGSKRLNKTGYWLNCALFCGVIGLTYGLLLGLRFPGNPGPIAIASALFCSSVIWFAEAIATRKSRLPSVAALLASITLVCGSACPLNLCWETNASEPKSNSMREWGRYYCEHGWKPVCRGGQPAWKSPKDGSIRPIYVPVKQINENGEPETVWCAKFEK